MPPDTKRCIYFLSLIYFLPAIAWLLFLTVTKTYQPQNPGLIPVFCAASIPLLLAASALLVLPAAGAVSCLWKGNARKLPCILLLTGCIGIGVFLLILLTIGNILSAIDGLRTASLMLFHTSLIASPLYCFAAFADEKAIGLLAKICGAAVGISGIVMTYLYYGVYLGAQAYDASPALTQGVWYYSTDAVIAGCGVWAAVGIAAGTAMLVSLVRGRACGE
ncbi:MAG: hypothetical protein Q4Q04_05365 [Methanocorpusculum sp.]|nr:hypothetical protein [Methanocorpusculum sp.]